MRTGELASLQYVKRSSVPRHDLFVLFKFKFMQIEGAVSVDAVD